MAVRETKEERVLRWITEAIRPHLGFVCTDDVASDLIFTLFEQDGFDWPKEKVKGWARRRLGWSFAKYASGKEISDHRFVGELDRDDGFGMEGAIAFFGRSPARQLTVAYASQMRERLDALPKTQRQCLNILADGGTPIDVAKEMGVSMPLALTLIKEARQWFHRVEADVSSWRQIEG